MNKPIVSIVKYEKPLDSVRKAVDLSHGLDHLPSNARVFIKPNILFGKCMYQAHKENSDIQEVIAIKGCPPKPEKVCEALQKAGIDVNPSIFENMDLIPGKFLKRYAGKPEFDEAFFKIN